MIKENLFAPDCIRTFTGIYVNVFEPTPEMFCIEDIAHSLSQQCRFSGHLPQFYSVAEHSILCAGYVKYDSKLGALLHDATEAYMLDIPSPIKKRLKDYKEIENKLMECIAFTFGFEYPLSKDIKKVDEIILKTEWNELMLNNNNKNCFACYSPKQAEAIFLRTFNQLKK